MGEVGKKGRETDLHVEHDCCYFGLIVKRVTFVPALSVECGINEREDCFSGPVLKSER